MTTETTSDAEPAAPLVVVNIAGEGEVPGALNVNGKWLAGPNWKSGDADRGNPTLADLEAQGHRFLLVDDLSKLPFADASVDVVYTNHVCIDVVSWLGPCPSRKEIDRILKPGCPWYRDGVLEKRP